MDQTKIIFSQSQSTILIGEVGTNFLQKSFSVSAPDFYMIDEDYSIGHVKDLLHFVFLKPYNSSHKLAVIKNFENLNIQAANSLLKTLEEPPAYARIVLTTLNEQKILPTILSRCVKIRLDFTADLNLPENYLSPEELGQKPLAYRFKWAAEVAESPNAEKIIIHWQNFYREKLLKGENVLSILKRLSAARDLLQTNISVKLLLENLLLTFET